MKNLFATVCVVESQGPNGGKSGHGVFIAPDVVLTAAHILFGSHYTRCINQDGVEARAVVDSKYNKLNSDLDLICFELSAPLAPAVVKPSGDFNNLYVNGGCLAHRFSGHPEAWPLRVSQPHLEMDFAEDGGKTITLKSDYQISVGHSGSPVFNKKGELVSMVSSGEYDNFEDFIREKPTHLFNGPSPYELASFIRRALT